MLAEYTEAAGASSLIWAKSYVYAGSRLLSTITKNGASETTEYHHPDRLGTKLVTNTATNTAKSQATLPFGTAISSETTATTNQKFTSYDRSGATGLDYAVNRTYNSGQSRFTQVDPIGMASASIGDPQSMNLFAYVTNDPVGFVDPSGLVHDIDRAYDFIRALREAVRVLRTNIICRSFFHRKSLRGNPADLLLGFLYSGNITYGNRYQVKDAKRNVSQKRFPSRVNAVTIGGGRGVPGVIRFPGNSKNTSVKSITINSNGAFFNSRPNSARYPGLTARQARASIVLHEFAHAIVGGFPTDSARTKEGIAQSQRNREKINSICFPKPPKRLEVSPAQLVDSISNKGGGGAQIVWGRGVNAAASANAFANWVGSIRIYRVTVTVLPDKPDPQDPPAQ